MQAANKGMYTHSVFCMLLLLLLFFSFTRKQSAQIILLFVPRLLCFARGILAAQMLPSENRRV
jgi:hypothetical protein